MIRAAPLFIWILWPVCLYSESPTNRLVSNKATVTAIYRTTPQLVRAALIEKAGTLWRVTLDKSSKQPVFRTVKSKRSEIRSKREAEAHLTIEELEFTWMPPPVPKQKVSQGGNIEPLPSTIWITIGCLKTNDAFTFVSVFRCLEESTTLHVPFTEIPAGRGKSDGYGVYESDVTWLRGLLRTNEFVQLLFSGYSYDMELVEQLRGMKR